MQKDWYEIRGGQRLEGTVTISGAKNAAVAIIPAAILAGETCVLENLPHIQDVQSLKEILEELGVTVDYTEGDCMRIANAEKHQSAQRSGQQHARFLLSAWRAARSLS